VSAAARPNSLEPSSAERVGGGQAQQLGAVEQAERVGGGQAQQLGAVEQEERVGGQAQQLGAVEQAKRVGGQAQQLGAVERRACQRRTGPTAWSRRRVGSRMDGKRGLDRVELRQLACIWLVIVPKKKVPSQKRATSSRAGERC
jgi:hypothetical protein